MGTSFSHLALSVEDLERQTAFYRDVLDFDVGDTYRSEGPRSSDLMEIEDACFDGVFMRRGGFYLELLAHGRQKGDGSRLRNPEQLGYAHTSFLVDDAAATVAAATEHGGTFLRSLELSFGRTEEKTQIFFLLDPEGNRIELISHPSEEEAGKHAEFLGAARVGWPAR